MTPIQRSAVTKCSRFLTVDATCGTAKNCLQSAQIVCLVYMCLYSTLRILFLVRQRWPSPSSKPPSHWLKLKGFGSCGKVCTGAINRFVVRIERSTSFEIKRGAFLVLPNFLMVVVPVSCFLSAVIFVDIAVISNKRKHSIFASKRSGPGRIRTADFSSIKRTL